MRGMSMKVNNERNLKKNYKGLKELQKKRGSQDKERKQETGGQN